VAIIGAIAVVAIADAANRAGDSSPAVIHACYDKHGKQKGVLRLADNCRDGEKPVEWGAEGPAGSQGPAGGAGPTGATGPAGTTGPAGSARAYGQVADDPATLTRAKGNPTITHTSDSGRYCISIPGASPATDVMFVAITDNGDHYPGDYVLDYDFNPPHLNGDGSETAYAVWSPNNDTFFPATQNCPASQFQVITWSGSTGDFGTNDVSINDSSYDDQPFTFIVP
jgi:hypothetical protein